MIYIASPYSDPNPFVENARYEAAERFWGELLRAGVPSISPIAACVPVSRRFALPGHAAFWEAQNRRLLAACDRVYVLTLPGWDASRGVRLELDWAREMGLPVYYREP